MALFQYVTERRIQEAIDRGELDGLPGTGKPIPDLDQPYDGMWWVRKWMQREEIDAAAELRAERGGTAAAGARGQAELRRSGR